LDNIFNNFFVRNNYNVIIPENLHTLIPTWAVAKLKRGKIVYNIADFILMHTFQLEYDNKKNSCCYRERFFIKRINTTLRVDESRSEQIGTIEWRNISIIYNSPYDNYDSLAKTSIKETILCIDL
jgi:hypothetical protein